MKDFDRQVQFWAHMLDETKHQSYYDVYMQTNPKDEPAKLVYNLVEEFAADMKKQKFNWNSLVNYKHPVAKQHVVNWLYVDEACKNLKYHYHWDLIPAQTYAAIITRYVAMMDAAGGQRYLSELDYENVRRGVSKKTIEQCLDLICHNTNVLEANNLLVNDDAFANKTFKKAGLPALLQYNAMDKVFMNNYFPVLRIYEAWASYGRGRAGEEYVCDSDYGPEKLKKVLRDCEYDADEVELIATLNKAVDVVHFRSDLAAAFLEGGEKTASMVSNLPRGIVV